MSPACIKALVSSSFLFFCLSVVVQHLKTYKLFLSFQNMELNKSLEYRICFDRVKNLDEIKKNENYVGSVEVDGNIYAITIDKNSKKKELAKSIVPNIIPCFKDVYYAKLDKKRKVLEHFETFQDEYINFPKFWEKCKRNVVYSNI